MKGTVLQPNPPKTSSPFTPDQEVLDRIAAYLREYRNATEHEIIRFLDILVFSEGHLFNYSVEDEPRISIAIQFCADPEGQMYLF